MSRIINKSESIVPFHLLDSVTNTRSVRLLKVLATNLLVTKQNIYYLVAASESQCVAWPLGSRF